MIFGPNNDRFQEAADLKSCGGGVEITDNVTFSQCMDKFIADENELEKASQEAGTYVKMKSGATEKILKALKL